MTTYSQMEADLGGCGECVGGAKVYPFFVELAKYKIATCGMCRMQYHLCANVSTCGCGVKTFHGNLVDSPENRAQLARNKSKPKLVLRDGI